MSNVATGMIPAAIERDLITVVSQGLRCVDTSHAELQSGSDSPSRVHTCCLTERQFAGIFNLATLANWAVAVRAKGKQAHAFVICDHSHFVTVLVLFARREIWFCDSMQNQSSCSTGSFGIVEQVLDATVGQNTGWTWHSTAVHVQLGEIDSSHCGIWSCWSVALCDLYLQNAAAQNTSFREFLISQYALNGVNELTQRSRPAREAVAHANTTAVLALRAVYRQQLAAFALTGDPGRTLQGGNYLRPREEPAAYGMPVSFVGPMLRVKRTKFR